MMTKYVVLNEYMEVVSSNIADRDRAFELAGEEAQEQSEAHYVYQLVGKAEVNVTLSEVTE